MARSQDISLEDIPAFAQEWTELAAEADKAAPGASSRLAIQRRRL